MASASEHRLATEAGDYLRAKNFKTLVEWLTAEVIFARPEDPVAFIAAVSHAKVRARAEGGEFTPDEASDLLAEVYANPPAKGTTFDEPGAAERAEAERAAAEAEAARSEATRAVADAKRAAEDAVSAARSSEGNGVARKAMLERVLAASRAIGGELNPERATSKIVEQACESLHAERATLWALKEDAEGRMLTPMVTGDEAVKSVRVPVGSGIVGTVAATGAAANIPDAYEDDRFNQEVDKDTGFRTRAILCLPVTDAHGDTVGVLQVMNKRPGPAAQSSAASPEACFSKDDEALGLMLSEHIGVALRNAQTFSDAVSARAKSDAMLSLVRTLHREAASAASITFAIVAKTPAIVDAERCSFFLSDHKHNELISVQGDVDVRIPMDKGIVGHVVSTKETVNIPDAYKDDRWGGAALDRKNAFRTRAILCMPLVGSGEDGGAGEVVGVVQCINKRGGGAFSDEDETILGTFLDLVAPIVERSALFRHASKPVMEDEGSELTGHALAGDHAKAAAAAAQPAIAEEDEGEEEEEEEEADDDDDDGGDGDADEPPPPPPAPAADGQ